MAENETWECPMCGSNAYQRYGGIRVPATQYSKNGEPTQIHKMINQHFMCKGCSIFFGNPKLFNAKKIAVKNYHRLTQEISKMDLSSIAEDDIGNQFMNMIAEIDKA